MLSAAQLRRPAALVVVATLAVGAGLTHASTAQAANAPVASGSATWGYKESFRTYIAEEVARIPTGSKERSSISPSQGASFAGSNPSSRTPAVNKASFTWPVTGGSFDAASKSGSVKMSGRVTFAYPNHWINALALSNPTIKLTGSGNGSLYLDIKGDLYGGTSGSPKQTFSKKQVEFAKLSNAKVATSGSRVSVGADVRITSAGSDAVDHYYAAGDSLDDLEVTFTAKPKAVAAAPKPVQSNPSTNSGATGNTGAPGATTNPSTGATTPNSTTPGATTSATTPATPGAAGAVPPTTGATTPTTDGESTIDANFAATTASSTSAGPLLLGLLAAAVVIFAAVAGFVALRRKGSAGTAGSDNAA